MQIYGAKQLASSFQTVRKNTIQIAEDIPESQYGFVPAQGCRSVAQLLSHLIFTPTVWTEIHSQRLTDLSKYDFPEFRKRAFAFETTPRSKKELLELLRTEGDKFVTFLSALSEEVLADEVKPGFGDPVSRLEGLHGAKEHEMHHRGQLMLIQRMLGIVPHLTRIMNERLKGLETSKAAKS